MDIRPRNMGKQLGHNVSKYKLSNFHQNLIFERDYEAMKVSNL
jgi:hypothetical protein